MNSARSGFAPVENGQLYYEVEGEGPAVLLIHAGVADHTMWDPQMEPLTKDHTVIRYDTRGFGRSRTEDTAFSNRQDIRDLLAHLGIDKVTIVGNSRGGVIALDSALEFPDMVSGIVWICGGVSGYEAESPAEEVAWFDRLEALWEAKDWDRLSDLEMHTWANGIGQREDRAPTHVREKLRAMIYAINTRQDGEPTPRPLEPPAAGRLKQITCPVLVIIGELDTSGTRASADLLARELPRVRKVSFPDSAHMVSMEKPEETNALLLDFLRGL